METNENLAPITGAAADTSEPPVTVVLVHGAFVDGSGWRAVHDRLRRDGFAVSVVQNPLRSLDDDVATTLRAIAAAPGKVVLVGHSYGGVVISQAGNDAKVSALVYVAAFVADAGESIQTISAASPHAAKPPFVHTGDGSVVFDPTKFTDIFGADLSPDIAAFMTASLKPWAIESMAGKVDEAAWRTKPSWYVIATDDRLVQPDVQRIMAAKAGARIVEAPGSHAIFMTQPDIVADAIVLAVDATSAPANQ